MKTKTKWHKLALKEGRRLRFLDQTFPIQPFYRPSKVVAKIMPAHIGGMRTVLIVWNAVRRRMVLREGIEPTTNGS